MAEGRGGPLIIHADKIIIKKKKKRRWQGSVRTRSSAPAKGSGGLALGRFGAWRAVRTRLRRGGPLGNELLAVIAPEHPLGPGPAQWYLGAAALNPPNNIPTEQVMSALGWDKVEGGWLIQAVIHTHTQVEEYCTRKREDSSKAGERRQKEAKT